MRRASATLRVVFGNTSDPLATGLVSSLARPGGHVTGVSQAAAQLTAKRLQLLKDILPDLAVVGAMVDPAQPATDVLRETIAAASSLGLRLLRLDVRTGEDFDLALFGSGARRCGRNDVDWQYSRYEREPAHRCPRPHLRARHRDRWEQPPT